MNSILVKVLKFLFLMPNKQLISRFLISFCKWNVLHSYLVWQKQSIYIWGKKIVLYGWEFLALNAYWLHSSYRIWVWFIFYIRNLKIYLTWFICTVLLGVTTFDPEDNKPIQFQIEFVVAGGIMNCWYSIGTLYSSV